MILPRLKIMGGRVIDPASRLDKVIDIYIADGKIFALGAAPAGFSSDKIIDARNKVVCPGLIDICARLREPGLEHKATIASETDAAARGGITTLVTPPDTDPVIDTPAVVELIHQRASNDGKAKVEVLGAMTQMLDGEHLAEMGALRAAGCVGVSNATVPLKSSQIMRRVMEYAATFDLTVFVLPNDPDLSLDGVIHEGQVSTRLGLPGIPETAETVILARDLLLAEQTGARIHVLHVSTRRGVQMIADAKRRGLNVTASVTAHHLILDQSNALDFNSACNVFPPLRTSDDRAGLREGIKNNTVGLICSDHQPHESDAKQNPFPTTQPGISALETLLPLTLMAGAATGITLPQTLALVTLAPAQVLNIDKGQIKPSASADLCIFEPDREWQLSKSNMKSRGHNSPFLNRNLRGSVSETLVEGKIVYRRDP